MDIDTILSYKDKRPNMVKTLLGKPKHTTIYDSLLDICEIFSKRTFNADTLKLVQNKILLLYRHIIGPLIDKIRPIMESIVIDPFSNTTLHIELLEIFELIFAPMFTETQLLLLRSKFIRIKVMLTHKDCIEIQRALRCKYMMMPATITDRLTSSQLVII
jgi:hypothetical protein